MGPIKITQDVESLLKATQIIDDIFAKLLVSSEVSNEWIKWNKWFRQQKEKFNSNKIGVPTYFVQIKRIQEFLLETTPLTIDELFDIEVQERKKNYDLNEIRLKEPEKYTELETKELTEKLYVQLTKTSSDIRKNQKVESLASKKREARFGRSLLPNIEDEINRIKSNEFIFNDNDHEYAQLGELFLELGRLDSAKDNFNRILNFKLKRAMLCWLAFLKKDHTSFERNFLQAFPETFKPKKAGPYFLSFLIGNEKNFMYEIDSNGNRCVTYCFSTGIYRITQLEIFRAFLDDLQVTPDGRLAIWFRPTKKKNHFLTENVTYLDFKQVLEW